MGWMSTRALSAVLLSANLLFFSCDDDDDEIVFVDDVSVEVTGDDGVEFDGFVEDDNGARILSGTVPFTEDYLNQVRFFDIELSKTQTGSGELCVRAIGSGQSRQDCTTDSLGTVHVTLVF